MRGGFGLALVAWLTISGCAGEPPQEQSPLAVLQRRLPVTPGINLIVISFDALRADALGVYGSSKPLSPNLDAFAAEATVFERAYTVAPVTPTSFAAAFTGLLPTRVFHGWDLVFDDTLAVRLRDAGYRTGAFFNNVQLTRERHFDSGFTTYDLRGRGPDEPIIESALAWLDEKPAEKFFAWVHFLTPHSPYTYREEAKHLYDESYRGEFERTTGGAFDTDDPLEIERIRSLYQGEVLHGDRLFGMLLAGLRERGLLEASLIVVTSDHGEEFKEHGGFQHDRLTEEHVRVPLLVRHPAAAGSALSSVLVSNLDLFPTLLAIAGVDSGAPRDGRDWTSLETEPDTVAGVSMTGAKARWLSLRRGSLKVILTCMPERSVALYDLDTDPAELINVFAARQAEGRALLRDLAVLLGGESCGVMQAAVRDVDATVGLRDDQIETLKALGYLDD